jgi:hypothetical protein
MSLRTAERVSRGRSAMAAVSTNFIKSYDAKVGRGPVNEAGWQL